jgi:LacI family transcriptional regulator
VPGQLTVIGFDDIRAAGWPLIGLTTVHCDLEALARTGVELLVAEMSNPAPVAAVSRIPVRPARRRTPPSPGTDD